MSAWLNGWKYRKQHWINPAVGAGTKYPIRIKVLSEPSGYYSTFALVETPKRVQATPIISRGVFGAWDDLNIGVPRIIEIAGQRRCYFLGQKTVGQVCAVGFAYSTDANEDPPITWTKYAGNPILEKGAGADWDNCANGIRLGSIIQIGALYYLYYSCEPDQVAGKRGQIGVATSPDGITWTKHGSNPILSPDLVTEWQACLPYVIESGGIYYMYYTVATTNTWWVPDRIRVATSVDGVTWIKVGTVLDIGGGAAWDNTWIEDKMVYPCADGGFAMVYDGCNGVRWRIGFAWAPNPTNVFTKRTDNPMLSGSGVVGQFDQLDVATGAVYRAASGQMYLFYQGSALAWTQWDMGLALFTELFLENNAEANFDDLRFTDDEGGTPLDFWLESDYVAGSWGIVWVEVEDSLETAIQTIMAYYGKPDAVSASNGFNTFLFFDDFSIDLSQWTVESGTWSIIGGELRQTNPAAATSYRIFAGNPAWTNVVIRVKLRNISGYTATYVKGRATSPTICYAQEVSNKVNTNRLVRSEAVVLDTDLSTADGVNVIVELIMIGAVHEGRINGINVTGPWPDAVIASGKMGFRTYGTVAAFDDVYVRKIVSPEPLQGRWGAQQRRFLQNVTLRQGVEAKIV